MIQFNNNTDSRELYLGVHRNAGRDSVRHLRTSLDILQKVLKFKVITLSSDLTFEFTFQSSGISFRILKRFTPKCFAMVCTSALHMDRSIACSKLQGLPLSWRPGVYDRSRATFQVSGFQPFRYQVTMLPAVQFKYSASNGQMLSTWRQPFSHPCHHLSKKRQSISCPSASKSFVCVELAGDEMPVFWVVRVFRGVGSHVAPARKEHLKRPIELPPY